VGLFENLAPRAKAAPFSPGALLPAWLNRQLFWTDWDNAKAIAEGFKASVWVYRALGAIASAAASIPWYVATKSRGGDWARMDGHPLEILLEDPNPQSSRQELIERVVLSLGLAGEAFIAKTVLSSGMVAELWPLLPVGMTVLPSSTDFIAGYRYEQSGIRRDFQPVEIIHALFPDPANLYRGLSPLKVAGRVVDTDVQATEWNKIALQNRAVTDGMFSFEQPLTTQKWEEARQRVREQYGGSGNARTPWVMDSSAKWIPMALSPVDMDFIEGRKLTREEICQAFGVPPTFFGIGDPTYSNFQTAEKVLWNNTIVPLLERLAGVLSRTLLPHFGRPSELWLRYDLGGVKALKGDVLIKSQAFATLTASGVPANAAIEMLELDLEPIEGGDAPNGLRPLAPAFPFTGEPTKAWAPGERKAARDQVEAITRIADELSPAIAALFLEAVEALKATVPLAKIVLALASGRIEDVVKLLPFDALADRLGTMASFLAEAMTKAGAVAARQVAEAIGAEVPFEGEGASKAWADAHAAATAKQLTESGREAVRAAAQDAQADSAASLGGWELAGWAAALILGLSTQQSGKLLAFIREKVSGGLSGEKLRAAAESYATGLTAERAASVAEDQSLIAANRGRREAWDQAESSGAISAAKRRFLTERDEDVCPICRPMDGQTIGLHDKYWSPYSLLHYDGPGPDYVHRKCRCGEVIVAYGPA